jgi:hypothetical protein
MTDWKEKARRRLGIEEVKIDPDFLPAFEENEKNEEFGDVEKNIRARGKTDKTDESSDVHPSSTQNSEQLFIETENLTEGFDLSVWQSSQNSKNRSDSTKLTKASDADDEPTKLTKPPSNDPLSDEPTKLTKPLSGEHAALLRTIESAHPPDVGDGQWEVALRGLRAFLAAGHADEALRLGWSHDELFRIPPAWSCISECGAALMIGDAEVIGISAEKIQIKTASGATQSFTRRPEPDLVLAYRANYAALRRDLKHEDAEPAAYDRVVALCQSTGLDLETSKQRALAAMKEALRR